MPVPQTFLVGVIPAGNGSTPIPGDICKVGRDRGSGDHHHHGPFGGLGRCPRGDGDVRKPKQRGVPASSGRRGAGRAATRSPLLPNGFIREWEILP